MPKEYIQVFQSKGNTKIKSIRMLIDNKSEFCGNTF